MTSGTGKTALIFGASGISGWALMRECLSFPSTETFSRVIGLSNRPSSIEELRLPHDQRLELYTSLDLTDGYQTIRRLESIPGIEDVTHAYFVTYTGHSSSAHDQVDVSSTIVNNALVAIQKLCTNLEFFVLQTGGKGYGSISTGWPPAPWKEDLPRLPEPYASEIFYYAQYDTLAKHAAQSSWKWSEIRPSFLPGFVPHNNAMNIAQCLGLYLSFYRSKKGADAICVFPGTQESWTALHTDSFQDLVARFHIHVSLHSGSTHGRSFNVGDGKSVSWEMKWPVVCEYFGLKGVGPIAKAEDQVYGIKWLMAARSSWPSWTSENGLKEDALSGVNWDILETSFSMPIRIDYDLSASQEIGFRETMEPGHGYLLAFDRLRAAKFLL